MVADTYDTTVIEAVVGNSSPTLGELIARERCFVAECGGVLVVGAAGRHARPRALGSPPMFAALECAQALGFEPHRARGGGNRFASVVARKTVTFEVDCHHPLPPVCPVLFI